MAARGLHGGFTRDRRIPEKGIRGREALPSSFAHATQHETRRYEHGIFVVPIVEVAIDRERNDNFFNFVRANYRSLNAIYAVPMIQSNSFAAIRSVNRYGFSDKSPYYLDKKFYQFFQSVLKRAKKFSSSIIMLLHCVTFELRFYNIHHTMSVCCNFERCLSLRLVDRS